MKCLCEGYIDYSILPRPEYFHGASPNSYILGGVNNHSMTPDDVGEVRLNKEFRSVLILLEVIRIEDSYITRE